jgi:hypothetical protein
MKNILGIIAATGFALTAFASSASAANIAEKMAMMAQCSATCNTQYLQCVASAQQLASTPMEGLNQVKTNFMNSTECGTAALACNSSCN